MLLKKDNLPVVIYFLVLLEIGRARKASESLPGRNLSGSVLAC